MIPQEIQDAVTRYAEKRFAPLPFVPGVTPVTVSGKTFDAAEMRLGVEAVLDGWWTEGHFTEEFEEAFSARLGRSFCALTNSGSSANLLAFSALTSHKLGDRRMVPGSEVITVAAGFPTTVAPIMQYGCIPVFVDVDPATYNVTLAHLEAARSSKTRAVMIAHTLGNPYPVREIAAWCKQHNLWLIEDTCDALGTQYDGQPVGTFGDLATFSFYPAHHITMGEGGAVVTSDAMLNKIVRSFRDWGRDCWCAPGKDNTCGIRFNWSLGNLPKGYDHKYTYSEFGYNLKVTDMQAAIGLAQLDKLDGFIDARRRNHAFLHAQLQPLASVLQLPVATEKADPSWFGFVITVNEQAPFTRDELTAFLNERKIATRLLFAGNLLKQPNMVAYAPPHRVAGALTATDRIMDRTFWVGCHPGLDEPRLTYIAESIKTFCESRGVVTPDARFKGERVLVTGGTGFIGSAVVNRLVASGAQVASLSRAGRAPQGAAGIAADLADAQGVMQAVAAFRPTVVVHAAAAGTTGAATPDDMIRANILGTQSVLNACKACRPNAVVVLGSWTEDVPNSTYGVTKRTATMLTQTWAAETRVPTVILRLASVYGPGEASHRLLPTLLASARTTTPATLGAPETVRDYIHVDDVVDAVLNAAHAPVQDGTVYNVGSGIGTSTQELVTLVQQAASQFPEPTWNTHPPRPWDIPRWVAEITRTTEALQWTPRRTLKHYVTNTLGRIL